MAEVYESRMVVEEPIHSGEFRPVIRCRVEDYGGNVYWDGPAESYDPRRCHPRGKSIRLIATEIAPSDGKQYVGGYTCNYFVGG